MVQIINKNKIKNSNISASTKSNQQIFWLVEKVCSILFHTDNVNQR